MFWGFFDCGCVRLSSVFMTFLFFKLPRFSHYMSSTISLAGGYLRICILFSAAAVTLKKRRIKAFQYPDQSELTVSDQSNVCVRVCA